MDTSKRLIACAAVVVPLGAAFAETPASNDVASASVAALKSSLKGSAIDVQDVRVTDSGVACIQYKEPGSSRGATSSEHAVVQGDKVLRSSLGNRRFEEAWKEHCTGARGESKDAE